MYAKHDGTPLRNATTTTIAPTGTISIIAGCSSGIEPLFALCYIRNVLDNANLVEVNPLFKEYTIREGIYSDELIRKIANQGSLQNLTKISSYVKKLFVTSMDIEPEWHVRIQAAFQKYTDNAVSKTINFPQDAPPRTIEKTFLLAYDLKCKGITVYRYGSRESQVLNIGSIRTNPEEETSVEELVTQTGECVKCM